MLGHIIVAVAVTAFGGFFFAVGYSAFAAVARLIRGLIMWLILLLVGFAAGYGYRAVRHECPFCRLWRTGRCPLCGKTL